MEAGGFELLAASLRADARDVDVFFDALATKLGAAFPDSTRVERDGFRGRGRVKEVSVELGEQRYTIQRAPTGAKATRAKSVRGIVLKNEELSLDEWIEELSHDVAESAERTERGRAALEQLLHE